MINNRQNGRRRGRGGAQVRGGPGNPDRGNRIDNRSRGNAAQLLEKYKNLARDSQMQGDRVMTEYYLQFADHYFRVLGESRQRFEDQQQRRPRDDFDYDDEDDGDVIEPPRDERRDPRPPTQPQVQAQPQPQPQPEPAQPREPQLEYGVEGEAAQDDEVRRGRRGRRSRRPVAEEGEAMAAAPRRIDVDRLPPAFAAEPEAPSAPAGGQAADPAPGDDEPPAPAPRRRGRRPKAEGEGDSSVAA